MFGINLKHSLAIVAVTVGMLAAAGSASAATNLVVYNGHAGLGASVYQHNQTGLDYLTPAATDGTSNTIMFAEATAVFSGDAYDNEMGLHAARRPTRER